TDDDLPKPAAGGTLGEGVQATAQGERGLTMEPLYQGEPILAVAAVDEKTAAEAIEAIEIEYQPLPFVVDPIESLRPNGANARAQGNVWMRPAAPPAAPGARGPANSAAGANAAAPQQPTPTGPAGEQRGTAPGAAPSPAQAAPAAGAAAGAAAGRDGRAGAGRGRGAGAAAPAPPQISVLKWTDDDFKSAGEGQMPVGKATDEWTFGNIEDGFKNADLVLDETFMTQSTGHQPLETRTAMAYWSNGKVYVHGSTQSTMQTVAAVARWVFPPTTNGAETAANASKVVIISEFTGGGFGSKIPGSIFMCIPALLSKKANAPVMMRITREEEHFIGRARPGILARVKIGFRKDGRITALDMYTICDNGPYDAQGDANTAAAIASLAYQPETMRYNGLAALTNTPPK